MPELIAKMRMVWVVVPVALFFSLSACAGSEQVQSPLTPTIINADVGMDAGPRHRLWGYWEGYIPESHDSIELLPIRMADIHLNARRLLEDTVCKYCIQVLNVEIDQAQGTLKADIQLRHPYPGLDRFTAFDVRGVVISDGSLYFPALDATVPDASLGDFTLLNPDGYTRLWNTLEFPPGSGPFKILEYSRGKFAAPGDFTGTVNPFIEYSQWPRSHFPAGGTMIRQFILKLVPGAIRFGYAVDASWEPPKIDPPVDIEYSFPPSANAIEPYVMTINQDDLLYDEIGSTADINVSCVDRQSVVAFTGVETFLEAPDLWTGTINPVTIGIAPDPPPWWNMLSAGFDVINELGASPGSYPALFMIMDPVEDFYLGDINHAYGLFRIAVSPKPQLEGEIVFVAPEVDPPFPPPALNVFLLDLDTMEETQLTPYIGLGAIFREPRINPAGTHMLLSFCPTPYASKIDVYEIGGSSWTATPSDEYDGDGDFHPDGEHILAVSGTQFDDTPNLYSMRYDGSERELIATAPDTVRNARWCPDGKRIIMTLGLEFSDPPNSALYVYDTESQEFTEILPAPGVDENPCWSPVPIDGHYLIAFDTSRDNHPEYDTDIYVVNPDTGEILCVMSGLGSNHPSFSPDGLTIVCSATYPGQDAELYTFDWREPLYKQLTDDDSYDGSPSWGWNW